MPKIGIEPLRRQQLIDATLQSIETHGFQGTTIITISKLAGMSSGIISHYFGSKQGLIEAAVRHLLEQLKLGLMEQLEANPNASHHDRLKMVVKTNFNYFQKSSPATHTWLCFWAQAAHDPELARLQTVNSKRLQSNLLYSFKHLISDPSIANRAARMTAAMIDGFWLRCTLSLQSAEAYKDAEQMCAEFIDLQIQRFGKQHALEKLC